MDGEGNGREHTQEGAQNRAKVHVLLHRPPPLEALAVDAARPGDGDVVHPLGRDDVAAGREPGDVVGDE